MGYTDYDNLNAGLAKAIALDHFPSVEEFYGEKTGQDVEDASWVGGELFFYTTTKKLFIQSATSGATATWQASGAFATTTSTSTSTSSSTSTSTSTSSTTTA